MCVVFTAQFERMRNPITVKLRLAVKKPLDGRGARSSEIIIELDNHWLMNESVIAWL